MCVSVYCCVTDCPLRVIRAIHGVQWDGMVCGSSPGVQSKSYAAWPYPPETDFMICVDSCNRTKDTSKVVYAYTSTDGTLLWPLVRALYIS